MLFQVESILDKDDFTLEELLDEDEIIQECKALNGCLINFLWEKSRVKQLIQYIVEEAPEDAEKQRTFKIALKYTLMQQKLFVQSLDMPHQA